METFIDGFIRKFEFPEEAAEVLGISSEKIFSDKAAAELFKSIIKDYEFDMCCNFGKIWEKAEKISERITIDDFTVKLLVIIGLSDALRKYYKEKGVSENIWFDSMSDVKNKMIECKLLYGIWGTFVADWFEGFFKMRLFGMGRLQFEIKTTGRKLEIGEAVINSDENVLFVHIPRIGTKLDRTETERSYENAARFFKPYFSTGFIPFYCQSWLLFSTTLSFLSPESNIYKFAKDYTIIENVSYEDYSQVWRLFDRFYEGDINGLPQDTSLRKKYAEHIKSGGKFGYGTGVYLYYPK
ncbi:MAG: DUF5596 domain-containing protein [Clostridia bacterium]|nr:DUF5596 domain-containing protein [Clostridia bacterium]